MISDYQFNLEKTHRRALHHFMTRAQVSICLAFGMACIVLSKCAAGDVVETSLTEDKPACIEETRYIPVGDGTNFLKTSFFYFAKNTTNAQGQIIHDVDLPERLAPRQSFTNILPGGVSVSLKNPETKENDLSDLGHPNISGLSLYPMSKAPVGSKTSNHRPSIYLRCPPNGVITHSLVEISGVSDLPLSDVTYDVLNDSQPLMNQQGFINEEFFDEQKWEFTTNYFSCYDIQLSPGTNVLMIHCHYPSGGMATIKRIYVLRLDLKTNAPRFKIVWPHPDREVSGNNISIRGKVDDITDRVIGEMNVQGNMHRIYGLVERNGRLWLENVPLMSKTNVLKITVTDAIGNTSSTNLTIIKSNDKLSINPVPLEQLWQMQVTVTGHVSPPDRDVWVNGTKAEVESNGDWTAKGIRPSTGGVAVFDAVALLRSEKPVQTDVQITANKFEVRPVENSSLVASYSQTNIILNASQPTYGTFKVHLTGAAGQSFILQDSTNLIDWSPITTNLNSAATFDYEDANVTRYGCRFFRIVPLK